MSSQKKIKQEPCYLVNTNKEVHQIITENLGRSAMFSGKIKGVGPRYCPSIEDKVFRFNDRSSHHLFLEPEWSGSNQIYINGFSTSLPKNIQINALQKIKALENVEFIRPGYAIEYNVVPPRELKSSLESKKISGLFLAGQINGTSGYEEAAAQGLVAGVNAAKKTLSLQPLVLPRHVSYIGVLVDDLVTNHLDEPYRMFTSRAEHRLFLRSDNCYSRLFNIAREHALLTKKQNSLIKKYINELNAVFAFINKKRVKKNNKVVSMKKYLKRPEITFWGCSQNKTYKKTKLSQLAVFEAETTIKYEGYIKNELDRIEKNASLERLLIPLSFKYSAVGGLSNESRERLMAVQPETLGQASRIFGVRPTDITLLGFHLKNKSFT
jgi:tRNA uridine 5-carboxymethylaminomethyl modification enzyme